MVFRMYLSIPKYISSFKQKTGTNAVFCERTLSLSIFISASYVSLLKVPPASEPDSPLASPFRKPSQLSPLH